MNEDQFNQASHELSQEEIDSLYANPEKIPGVIYGEHGLFCSYPQPYGNYVGISIVARYSGRMVDVSFSQDDLEKIFYQLADTLGKLHGKRD